MSKELRTTHCIVEVVTDVETVKKRNRERADAERYDEELLDKVIARYESPDSRNRWDSPLVPVINDDIDLQLLSSHLYDRNPPPPNLSTQSQPVSSSDYLSRLDMKSRQIVEQILKSQDSGRYDSIVIPDAKTSLTLCRPVSSVELNKLRRQFINYTKMHPAQTDTEISGNFVQFIESNIT